MKLCEWPLEDVGKVFKMTRVCCGAPRVKLKVKFKQILYCIPEIGNGWGPAVLNTQYELDFIKQGQRGFNNSVPTGLVALLTNQMPQLTTLITLKIIQVLLSSQIMFYLFSTLHDLKKTIWILFHVFILTTYWIMPFKLKFLLIYFIINHIVTTFVWKSLKEMCKYWVLIIATFSVSDIFKICHSSDNISQNEIYFDNW